MDKDKVKELRLKLLINSPIEFYGLRLKVPTLSKIIELGNKDYNNKLLLYLLNDDMFFSGGSNGVSRFDNIILMPKYNAMLIDSLSFFFGIPIKDININIETLDSPSGKSISCSISIGGIFINKYRFEELRELIMILTRTEELKPKEEEAIEFKDKSYEERFKRYLEAKNRHDIEKENKKQGNDLYFMITYLSLNTGRHFSDIADMNMEQFNALFRATMYNEQNEFELTKLSTGVIGADGLDIKSLFERIQGMS